MKRYDPFFIDELGSYCQAQMEQDEDGDYVAYEDAQSEITRLRDRVAELEKQLNLERSYNACQDYAIPMNSCECGRWKHPSYDKCLVCSYKS